MKAKVINISSEDYEKEFKVRRMNYDQIIVNYPNREGIQVFNIEEVEVISEGEVDDFLIKNKFMLKIKLNRGISINFYNELLESMSEITKEKIFDLNLLRDKYKVNKRGIWEKDIVLVLNEKIPLNILATGKNFKREGISITINPIEKNQFIIGATGDIRRIEEEINIRKNQLIHYGKAIQDINSTNVSKNNMLLS